MEDEILIRANVCQVLRDHGFRAIEASTAVEAMAVFDVGESIDLVFCDASLPGRFGAEDLAAWVRRKFPDVKMLVASSTAFDVSHPAFHEPTWEGPLLRKPYTPGVLLAYINGLLAD